MTGRGKGKKVPKAKVRAPVVELPKKRKRATAVKAPRTRVRAKKAAKQKSIQKTATKKKPVRSTLKKSQRNRAASHKTPKPKPNQRTPKKRSPALTGQGKRRAPKVISKSSADRALDRKRKRYIRESLQRGLDGTTRGRSVSDTETLLRQAVAADLFGKEQSGQKISQVEKDWFYGYASPTGRVARHYSRLRWENEALGGKIRRRLSRAYEEGGDDQLEDIASRVATEFSVPLREVYTLFWSG